MRRARAQMSISLVMSVIIALVSITLVFVMASKYMNSSKVYCSTISALGTPFTSQDARENCKRLYSIKTVLLKPSREHITSFLSGREKLIDASGNVSFMLPRTAVIRNASLEITTAPSLLKTFNSGGSTKQSAEWFYNLNGGTNTILFTIPRDAKVNRALAVIRGKDSPPLVDMVFVIDTSGSMENEWRSLCEDIGVLKSHLSKSYNMSIMVYLLWNVFSVVNGNCNNIDTSTEEEKLTYSKQSTVLNTHTNIRFKDIDPSHLNVKSDDSSESWAIGGIWAIENHPWRQGSKKLLFPISDSDPTGGTGEFYDETNDEGEAVRVLIDSAKNNGVYVFPVYGDKPLPKNVRKKKYDEGYGIGYDKCSDAPSGEHSTCSKIMGWLKNIADSTGGNVTSYKDAPRLLRAIKNAVASNFPRNVSVNISDGSKTINSAFIKGPLDNSNSPYPVRFGNQLSRLLSSCSGSCDFNMDFHSESEGTIILDSFTVDYEKPASAIKITGQGAPMRLGVGDKETININDTIEDQLGACSEDSCIVQINATLTGRMKLYNPYVEYDEFPLMDKLVEQLSECWARAGSGEEKRGILCAEIELPDEFRLLKPLTKQEIVSALKKRVSCDEREPTCLASASKIDVRGEPGMSEHILVEYSPELRGIVIS